MSAADRYGLEVPDFATLSAGAEAFFFGDFRRPATRLGVNSERGARFLDFRP